MMRLLQRSSNHKADAINLVTGLSLILSDPSAYKSGKSLPPDPVLSYIQSGITRFGILPTRNLRNQGVKEPLSVASKGRFLELQPNPLRNETHKPKDVYPYDVCVSFAGSDRKVVERICRVLKTKYNCKVFYDQFESSNIWGKNLVDFLHEVYFSNSRFCVVFLSKAYQSRVWSQHEFRAAKQRDLTERGYLLPVILEEDACPDELKGTSYWAFAKGGEKELAKVIHERVVNWYKTYWISEEEVCEIFLRDILISGFLDPFAEHIETATDEEKFGLFALGLIVGVRAHVTEEVGKVFDMLLFHHPLVASLFDKEGFFGFDGETPWICRFENGGDPLMIKADYVNQTLHERWPKLFPSKSAKKRRTSKKR